MRLAELVRSGSARSDRGSLTLFEHELEPSKFCFTPTGFELELTTPNPDPRDPATQSKWIVAGRERIRQ